MTPKLCIGNARKDASLALATLESGRPSVEVNFPAIKIGVEAIKIFFASCREPVRLAVNGASLALALALGNGPGRYPMKEVFLRFTHHDSSHEISDNAQARDLAAGAQHPWTDVLTLGWH